MYTLTTHDATLLALGVLGIATLLVLGVFARFPRATRVVTGVVECPMIGGRTRAELVRDVWTLRFTDVTCCSVLGRGGIRFCTRGCLRSGRC